MPWPTNGPAFHSLQVLRRVKEQRHKLILIAPLWRNQPWVSVVIPAAEISPVADPLETGPPLSSERHDMASTARVVGPACVAARREPFVLAERILDTMAEARAPSTRRLYALKLSIFSAWCQDLDPVTSNASVVLSFLQEMLDKQRSSSTIKFNATAIAAFHALLLADRWADIVQ